MTLADCFKYRNRVGLDTAVEVVRFYRERKRIKVEEPHALCCDLPGDKDHPLLYIGASVMTGSVKNIAASVPFDISAEILPDLLSKPDKTIERLSAGIPTEA